MIGLGIMGGLMGEVFCQSGFTVLGYDPAIKAQQRFKKSWRPCHISDRAAWAEC
jgi:3-hydroxyisobutyrate dehydrogenase-like beta-hydroxyacid dehydrogenase